MSPLRGDIFLAEVIYNNCNDARPVIIVRVNKDGSFVAVSLLSSALKLFDPNRHFLLDESRGEFSATGLTRKSYASSAIAQLDASRLIRKLGKLDGPLSAEFFDWLGA
jgi:hypothetical protein